MKKVLRNIAVLFLSGCLLLSISACGSGKEESDKDVSGNQNIVDKNDGTTDDTVQNNDEMQKDEITNQRESHDFTIDNNTDNYFSYDDIKDREVSGEFLGYSPYTDPLRAVADASNCSRIIVVGKVTSKYYGEKYRDVDKSLGAFTLYDFEITESLRGDFVTGDKITIAQYGGYLRGESVMDNTVASAMYAEAECNENTVIRICHESNSPEFEIGDSYVMFLEDGAAVFSTMELVGDWMGAYKVNDDNTVSRYKGNDEFWTYGTLDELKKDVEEHPFDRVRYYESKTMKLLFD